MQRGIDIDPCILLQTRRVEPEIREIANPETLDLLPAARKVERSGRGDPVQGTGERSPVRQCRREAAQHGGGRTAHPWIPLSVWSEAFRDHRFNVCREFGMSLHDAIERCFLEGVQVTEPYRTDSGAPRLAEHQRTFAEEITVPQNGLYRGSVLCKDLHFPPSDEVHFLALSRRRGTPGRRACTHADAWPERSHAPVLRSPL